MLAACGLVQVCRAKLPTSQCDNPMIPARDGLNVYKQIDGFEHDDVTVIYDDRVNRTEFLSLRIAQEQLRYDNSNCSQYRADPFWRPLDVTAQIVPYRLGGSCDRKNMIPMKVDCVNGMLKTFESWIVEDVEMCDVIRYCVKMLYADDKTDRPYEIIYRAYTQPGNNYLHSIALNNPYLDECRPMAHRL